MEWTRCNECGKKFPRTETGRTRLLCSNRCAVRRWRRMNPGRECSHGRVHTCRIHAQS